MSTIYTNGVAPGALPLVGHAWQFLRDPDKFLDSLPGYGDLVEMRLGPKRVYVPCNPELLQEVLVDGRTFDKGGAMFDKTRDFFGNGLGTCPHKDHRRQRLLMQPAFHRSQLDRYAVVMEKEVAAMTSSWRDGQEREVFPELYSLTLRILTRTIFPVNVTTETIERVEDAAETAFRGAFQRMFLPGLIYRIPSPGNRRYSEAIEYLGATVRGIVEEQRRRGTGDGSLLAELIASRSDETAAGMTDSEICDQVTTLLLAGSEPIATVLCWALLLLAQHPGVERKLQEEVDTVLGGRPARLTDLPSLPVTERVFNESLRLRPPTPIFSRVTTKAVDMADLHLPPGTSIIFSSPVLHRHPGVYENSKTFDPDRWLPDRAARLPRGAFPAFGGGTRKCIGVDYAMMEAVIILASIVSGWHLRPAPGMDPRPTTISIIHRPRRLTMRFTARAGHGDRTPPVQARCPRHDRESA